MIEQPIDISAAVQIVRRGLVVVCVVATLGVGVGVIYADRTPPSAVSSALVVLSPNARDAPTQAVIAGSRDVLVSAERSALTATPLQDLRRRITVTEVASGVLSIQASASTATQAERLANAVAGSFVTFTSGVLVGRNRIVAQMLAPATTASAGSSSVRRLVWGGIGALAGAFVAMVGLLTVNRRGRRLRRRDEIANATGVPVLASLPAWHATRAHGWAKMLCRYKPNETEAWQLSSVLQRLDHGGEAAVPHRNGSGYLVAVLSMRSDRRALALGPQLAVFAASKGIKTALVIGPGQDGGTAALRAACAAYQPAGRAREHLHVSVADPGGPDRHPDASLTVVVAVIDDAAQMTAAIRTDAIVLAVSPGAARAGQLARYAAGIAADGGRLDGLLIADPDRADKTSGRIPSRTWPYSAPRPTRISGVPAGSVLSTISQPVRTTR